MPMGRDQPCVAARVVHSGAGLRLSKNPSERDIADAVRGALGNAALRENAERLQGLIAREIEADRGVEEMEALSHLAL
jgi:UDP:flavonoid glycosyltransferase YjiC (YdhE family)